MLELDSPVWDTIRASPGGTGALTAQLLARVQGGDESSWAELHHQVCHQNTVGEVAYVAAPHIVAIAREATPRLRALLLVTIGAIVASMRCYRRGAARVRDEWRTDFDCACAEARRLAADALREGRLESDDSLALIAALAALHGHENISLLLQDGPKPSCPECGRSIDFGDAEE